MLKTFMMSFSLAETSMNHRGLLLCDNILNCGVHSLKNFDIPLVNINNNVDNCPDQVNSLISEMNNYDQFVFAIPEYTGHYSAVFKNLMDWLVVAYNMNSSHGNSYPFSQRPVHVVTFTPTFKNSGGRHFDMTTHLLQDKMGADVKSTTVFNNCWNELVPTNLSLVQDFCKIVKECKKKDVTLDPQSKHNVENWNKLYKEWDETWTNL